jgi:hypothetical protein
VDVGGGGDGGEKTAGHAVTQPDSATCSVNSSFGSVRSLPKDTGHPTTIRCPRTRSKPSPDADADIAYTRGSSLPHPKRRIVGILLLE